MEIQNVDLEIETLFSSGRLGRSTSYTELYEGLRAYDEEQSWPSLPALDDVCEHSSLNHAHSQSLNKNGFLQRTVSANAIWAILHRQASICLPEPEVEEETADETDKIQDVVVKGADIKDIPTEYVVKGLQSNEFPAIGTFVDTHITPGFTYRVRQLGNQEFIFDGKALPLMSIGMGYGKRLTFKGDSLNKNDRFFWSDSQPDGYGFNIVALQPGDEFVVCDEEIRQIGRVCIEIVETTQQEISTKTFNGAIEKQILVTFSCTLQYGSEPHGLMSLRSEETLQMTGTVVVLKAKGQRVAITKCVKDITLPGFGCCTFNKEGCF